VWMLTNSLATQDVLGGATRATPALPNADALKKTALTPLELQPWPPSRKRPNNLYQRLGCGLPPRARFDRYKLFVGQNQCWIPSITLNTKRA